MSMSITYEYKHSALHPTSSAVCTHIWDRNPAIFRFLQFSSVAPGNCQNKTLTETECQSGVGAAAFVFGLEISYPEVYICASRQPSKQYLKIKTEYRS
jgi:hypothetical protein